MNRNELEQLLYKNFSNINDDTLKKLYQYYELLVHYSKLMNLTSLTELEDVYIKHFYDSLLLTKIENFSNVENICDIGTGAGFPGLVIKICFPQIKVVLIEPTTKRCNFLNTVIKELDLNDIIVINERAEEAITKYRNSFDLVTARAVSRLNILSELCVPFVKLGGIFAPMKGSSYQEEIDECQTCFKKIKINKIKIDLLSLPNDAGERAIISIIKTNETPLMYPREYAKIKKKPL